MKSIEKRDLYEAVSEHIALTGPTGPDERPYYTACCPFHAEENPSFVVFETTQRWVCYGCTPQGGDVVDFIARIKGIPLREAMELARVKTDEVDRLLRDIQQKEYTDRKDQFWLYTRLSNAMHKHSIAEVCAVQPKIQKALDNNQLELANRILRKLKV